MDEVKIDEKIDVFPAKYIDFLIDFQFIHLFVLQVMYCIALYSIALQ